LSFVISLIVMLLLSIHVRISIV